jgi:hypothetical protein
MGLVGLFVLMMVKGGGAVAWYKRSTAKTGKAQMRQDSTRTYEKDGRSH